MGKPFNSRNQNLSFRGEDLSKKRRGMGNDISYLRHLVKPSFHKIPLDRDLHVRWTLPTSRSNESPEWQPLQLFRVLNTKLTFTMSRYDTCTTFRGKPPLLREGPNGISFGDRKNPVVVLFRRGGNNMVKERNVRRSTKNKSEFQELVVL